MLCIKKRQVYNYLHYLQILQKVVFLHFLLYFRSVQSDKSHTFTNIAPIIFNVILLGIAIKIHAKIDIKIDIYDTVFALNPILVAILAITNDNGL